MDFLPDTIRSVALHFQKVRQRFPVDHVRIYLFQTLKALEYAADRFEWITVVGHHAARGPPLPWPTWTSSRALLLTVRCF